MNFQKDLQKHYEEDYNKDYKNGQKSRKEGRKDAVKTFIDSPPMFYFMVKKGDPMIRSNTNDIPMFHMR